MVAKKDRNNGDRPTKQKEKLAGFLYDIAKLIFAALVLGAVSPLVTNKVEDLNVPIAVYGAIATIVLGMIANRILKNL